MTELEKINHLQSELAKFKAKNINLNATIRNFKQAQKVAESKSCFSDTDKLIMLEGVLLAVVGSEALEPITKIVLSSFSDDAFWKKHKYSSIESILTALAKRTQH